MELALQAYVAAAAFAAEGAVFALGDGRVRFVADGLNETQAHDGAILAAAPHPSGAGLVTGGDDGRLVWSRLAGRKASSAALGHAPRWIDAVATSAASGLIAFASGREARVLDAGDPAFAAAFTLERAVAGLAFDAKGLRLAAATYGGAALWYARVVKQAPQTLRWAGSHIAVAFSPDGRFLLTAMQENALHGWRLSDAKDMRMGGYAAKPRSLAFPAKGTMMATSGAAGVVVWPLAGANGPMGRQAMELGADEDGGTLVTHVAASGAALVAGRDDGRVMALDPARPRVWTLREGRGSAVTALALASDERRVAFGCEDGTAGVIALG